MATSSSVPFNYGETTAQDTELVASARPGAKEQKCYDDCVKSPVAAAAVDDWVAEMRDKRGVKSVVSLLSDDEVEKTYAAEPGVEAAMRGAFGSDAYVRFDGKRLGQPGGATAADVVGAIDGLIAAGKAPVLVHCWGGGGRSGLVQAAWLAKKRGLSATDAAAAVAEHAKSLGVPRRVDVAALEAFLAA